MLNRVEKIGELPCGFRRAQLIHRNQIIILAGSDGGERLLLSDHIMNATDAFVDPCRRHDVARRLRGDLCSASTYGEFLLASSRPESSH